MNDATDVEWQSHSTAGLHALREYREAAAIDEYVAALRIAENFSPGDVRLVTSLRDLAGAYERDRRFGEAAQLSRRLLDLLEQMHGANSLELVATLEQLSRATRLLGDDEEADHLLQRALSIQERMLGPDHPMVMWSLHALALLNLSRKRFGSAEQFWLRAEPMAVAARSHGDNQALGQDAILDCLILVYRAWNRPDLMEATARRRLELAEVDAEDDLKFGSLFGHLGEALATQNRYAGAADAFRAAISRYQRWYRNILKAKRFRGPNAASTRERLRNSGHVQMSWLRRELARMLRGMGDTKEADRAERSVESALRRALVAREHDSSPDDLGALGLLTGLAEVYVARGKPEAAEPLYRRAIAIHEQEAQERIDRLGGPENARGRARTKVVLESHTAALRRDYAAVLRTLGREGDAALPGDLA